jgi:acyl-CoA dehydrogenase
VSAAAEALDGLRLRPPPELLAFQQSVRRFVDAELVPLEAQYTSCPPDDVLLVLRERAIAAGLYLPDVPEADGGLGLNWLGQALFWEEISRSPLVPARHLFVFGPMIGSILLGLQGELRERYLLPVVQGRKTACFAMTEADAGSDPTGMRTRAVRDGGDWVLTGAKRFITDAHRADFAQVIAVTSPGQGAAGMTCFLVDLDAPGVRRGARYPTVSGDAPGELVFDGVRVPDACRVGAEGQGFELAQQWVTSGRVLRHGARSLGVARRCLELGTRYAQQRRTFGQPLAQRQAIQFMLADTYLELELARGMVWRAAQELDDGGDARMASYLAKTSATEMGLRAVERCLQLHGGIGLTTELPIERMWREQRGFVITEGPAEVMRATIARHVLREYE